MLGEKERARKKKKKRERENVDVRVITCLSFVRRSVGFCTINLANSFAHLNHKFNRNSRLSFIVLKRVTNI